MRKRAELLAHIRNTNLQYNLPDLTRSLAARANRADVVDRFSDPSVAVGIQIDLELIDTYDRPITEVELKIMRAAMRAARNVLATSDMQCTRQEQVPASTRSQAAWPRLDHAP